MDPAARVKPIPPGEVTLIRSNATDISQLKSQIRGPTKLAIKFEREADLIIAKFSRVQHNVFDLVINSPFKIPTEVMEQKVRDYGRTVIEKLKERLLKVANEEDMAVDPEISKALQKLFSKKVCPLINAPPYFTGSGITDDRMKELKPAVLKILIDKILPAKEESGLSGSS